MSDLEKTIVLKRPLLSATPARARGLKVRAFLEKIGAERNCGDAC